MALTKRELEDVNEALQMEITSLRRENERLTTALTSTTERLRQLTEQNTKLTTRYGRLKTLLTEYLSQSTTTSVRTV